MLKTGNTTWLLLLLLGLAVPLEGIGAKGFEPCLASFEETPCTRESSRCFYQVASTLDQFEVASELLGSRLQVCPHNGWPQHYLAHILKALGDDRAELLYRNAIQSFSRSDEHFGEVYARRSLWGVLVKQNRLEEAWDQVQEMERLAEKSKVPEIEGRSLLHKAQHLYDQSRDYNEVYRLLKEAEELLFPGEAKTPQRDCLRILAAVSLELGHLDEAQRYFDRIAELGTGPADRVAGLVNVPLVLAHQYLRDPSPRHRARAIEEIQLNLGTIEDHGSWESLAFTHSQLGQLLGLPEGRPHFEACRDVTATHGSAARGSQCLVAWAGARARHRPGEADKALELLEQARQLARKSYDPQARAFVEGFAIHIYWLVLEPREALKRSKTSLQTLENFRHNQTAAETRARVFDTWSLDYQVFVGRLLETYLRTGDSEFVERAFDISERLRSRVLQESLQTPSPPIPLALTERREVVLKQMTELQRELFTGTLPEAALERVEAQLQALEMDFAEVQHRILRRRYPERRLPNPNFVSVEEVQAYLRPDEALVTFQLALDENFYGRFAGGSWVFVVTPSTLEAHRIPEGEILIRNLPTFLGLFKGRDGRESPLAARLHEILLEEGLRNLPLQTRRLILLPDASLHSVPFASLRSGTDGVPLAQRFALSRIPSATMWVDWRKQEVARGPRPALVLADPVLFSQDSPESFETYDAVRSPGDHSTVLVRSSELGPLPLAREEGRSLRRRLGPDILLRTGAAATESLLKTQDLSAFGILHFAAHARADVNQPDRSSVFLAPGSNPMTDGLLQFREIVDLDLDGRIVVLSACDTATGEILRGEGVLDLARAFFQGGAHAVVASLWPLRDDDGRDFFDAFYRHLAEGESLAGALQGAQVDRIEDGAPAAAWAGIVVLGDGSMVPFPDAQARLSFLAVVLLALGLFALAVAVMTILARRRAA